MHSLPSKLLARIARSPLPPAVVVGTGITGLTVARSLARHGVPVVAVDSVRRYYTGYSGAFHLLLAPALYGPEMIGFLEELATSLPRRAALFLSMDEHVKLVAPHGERFRELYHFEFPAADDVDLLMSKQRFAALADERGWPVPRTRSCETVEAVHAAARELTFPVILKPSVKNLAFRNHAPQKTFRCATAAELLEHYRLIAQWEKEAVIQEWIPGGDDEVYFSFHYLSQSLREVASFEGRKIRQYLPECGGTASAVGVPVERVSALSREILTATRCAGFGAVEYKRDPRTDRFFITEPTVGRVDLQVGVAIANGADIVARGYFHLVGRPYPRGTAPTHHVKWVIADRDLRAARYYVNRGGLTWAAYLAQMRGPKEFAVWSASDPRMLLGLARNWSGKPFRLARRAVRKLARVAASGRQNGGEARPAPATPRGSDGL